MHKILCDKCKKEFDEWHQEYRYEVKIYEKGTLPQRIELCDDCLKIFEKWMDEFIGIKEVAE